MPLPDTSPMAIPSSRLRQQDEIVVVAADAERGAAGARVVEARDRRVFLRKQPLLHVARDFDVARLLRARRHFGRNGRRQPAVLEREPGLRRHRVEQPDVRLREGLFRLLRPQAHDAQDLVVERQGQQQLRLQLFERASLRAGRQLHPRIRVVELHERVLLLAQPLHRHALRRNGHGRRRSIPERVRRPKRAAAVEENRNARHVQRFGDPRRDGLEQRSRFDHRPDLGGEVAQDRVRLVGLAEEPAIHPAAKPIGELAANRHDRHHAGDNARDARESGATGEQRRRRDTDRHQERDLNRANPSAGQHVLQSLPDDHAHVHRPMDDDDVRHGQGKREHHRDQRQEGPSRKAVLQSARRQEG